MRRGQPWTREDETRCETLFLEGKSDKEIGAALGRNPGTVNKKLHRLGHWRAPWGRYVPPVKPAGAP
jgi:IS30 family transposase